MKKYYLEPMISRLTEEEKELLQRIYEPKVVTIPDSDACRNLCVTPDGEIRIYGKLDKKHPEDWGIRVYSASTDGGLTWKTHLVKEEGVLGPATYNPRTGRYISTYPNEFLPELSKTFGKEGTWAILNDEGFDSANNRFVKLTDKKVHILKNPTWLDSCDRWFIVGEYTDEEHKKYIMVSFSDDDGESWNTQILEKYAPYFEQQEPHKGPRWQQYSCEPTIVEVKPGELMMIVRTSQNYHYQYRSYDNGITWEGPEPTVFHGTITMPVLHKLQDGRIVFFWCNNEPMPERDHTLTKPELSEDEKKGVWEDVFTNRDANHLAISEDGGQTWRGMRELFLNVIRNQADFRSFGDIGSRDKSVHQAEMLELPYNKLLVHFGQNSVSRRVVILDIDWLYEQERSENFQWGLKNLTTHMYVKSNLGGYRGFSGHCAYNRTNGALLMPDPDENFEEVLQICRIEDERLVYKKQGAVWNFPASKEGTVTVKLRVLKSGVALSLCDHWYNACDESVKAVAPVSVDIIGDMCKTGNAGANHWTEVSISYKLEAAGGIAEIRIDGELTQTLVIPGEWPNGFSYLHIQTLAEEEDMQGTLLKELHKTVPAR